MCSSDLKYDDQGLRGKKGKHAGDWTATGKQFQVPYIFKSLFSHEEITLDDLCETRSVSTNMYLDMNEQLPDVSRAERDLEKLTKRCNDLLKAIGYEGSYDQWLDDGKAEYGGGTLSEEDREKILAELKDLRKDRDVLLEEIAKGHNYVFVGMASAFCPVVPGSGGGWLMRKKDEKYDAVTGTKDQRWMESETVQQMNLEDCIDRSYFDRLVDEAIHDMAEFGDVEAFRHLADG